jgi:hypothetical protein
MKEQNAHLGAFVHCPLGCCRQRVCNTKRIIRVYEKINEGGSIEKNKKNIGQLSVVNN